MRGILERRGVAAAFAIIFAVAAVTYYTVADLTRLDRPAASGDTLPLRLTDAEFWGLVEEFSEPNGYFQSDNFLSNEWGAQEVIPKMLPNTPPGGVYLGVGPEQNFTYIQAFEPRMAFIVDIRRLNMLEHLLYKALFEAAANRSEFVALLFSRQFENVGEDASAATLLRAAHQGIGDRELFARNVERMLRLLTDIHGFKLSREDREDIRYVYNAFFESGPDLSYSFLDSYIRGPLSDMPTYSDLMQETDSKGRNWSFLANEEQFSRIQDLQRRNLIVPIVGDFAGPKAIRSVARYLRDHGARVRIFYVSNVEMYLFRSGNDWRNFYMNTASLPLDERSSFIRFALNGRSPLSFGNRRSQMWSSIHEVLAAFDAGTLVGYRDVVNMSH
jgi:hypothetical protein